MLSKILDRLSDHEFVRMDGFDAAVVNVAETSKGLHLLYSLSAIHSILINEHECENYDDCAEWYYANMLDLSSLEGGPIFLEDIILN
jgi:hypothetical protein